MPQFLNPGPKVLIALAHMHNDSLGLSGTGVNISTGKLGRITRFFTACADELGSVEVFIELDRLLRCRKGGFAE